MRRRFSKVMTAMLASGGLLLLGALAPSASAQVYSCPPGYYLASDYQCYAQGYAVTAPVTPYVYYPPYAYSYSYGYGYPRPYYYGPGIDFRFGFGGYHHGDGHGYGHHH